MELETAHPFHVKAYEKAWVIPSVPLGSKDDPEFVLSLFINAMKSGNYDGALQLWDKKSIRKINELDSRMGRTKADWITEWKRLYSGKSFLVRERIFYGDKYTLIPYYDLATESSLVLRETLAFVKIEGVWQLTLDLAENPVKTGWMNTKERVRRLANPNGER